MGWATIVWGFIKGLFGKGVVGDVLQQIINVINNSNATEIQKEQLITEVTLKYLDVQAQLGATRATAFGKWSALMAGVFLIGPAIWWSAIFLQSTLPALFPPGYHVLALPSDFYPWMTTIIGAIFFAPALSGISNKITSIGSGMPTGSFLGVNKLYNKE